MHACQIPSNREQISHYRALLKLCLDLGVGFIVFRGPVVRLRVHVLLHLST